MSQRKGGLGFIEASNQVIPSLMRIMRNDGGGSYLKICEAMWWLAVSWNTKGKGIS